jgi:hypothetical protein
MLFLCRGFVSFSIEVVRYKTTYIRSCYDLVEDNIEDTEIFFCRIFKYIVIVDY